MACSDERQASSLDAAVMADAARVDAGEPCADAMPRWPTGVDDGHCRTDSERVLEQRVGACLPPGNESTIPEAPLLWNGRGADADCKYELQLANEGCRTVLRVRAESKPVEGARARIELRDKQGALLLDRESTPRGQGNYAFELPPMDAVLHVHLFEQCAYADEASPRAHAAFEVSR